MPRRRSARSSAIAICRTRRANTKPRPRTRRKPTKPSAPPISAASPTMCERMLKPDEAGLYKLIWQRAVASQMASAELERTTVEIDAKGRRRHATACAPPAPWCCSTASSSSTRRARDDEEDEDDARLPKLAPGRHARRAAPSRPTSISPSRRRATPKRRSSRRWKSWASAARPPTPARSTVLQERDYVTLRQEAADPGGQGAAGHGIPGKLFPALCRIRFHRRSGRKARPDFRRQAGLEGRAARLLARFHRRRQRHQGTARRRKCSTR